MALQKSGTIEILCNLSLEAGVREDIINNLSGAVFSHEGRYLWLGTDELMAIERFTKIDVGVYGEHRRFEFKDLIEGFDEAKGEVDLEGLDYHDGCLWIVGSHSSKRKKVKIAADKFQISLKELKQIERQENRYLLARIPISDRGELEATAPKKARLKRSGSGNLLTQALANDEYLDLGRLIKNGEGASLPGNEFYLYLPGKENGLDIEGLAVWGNKVLLGLRGPVLRGIAILLEIEVEEGLPSEFNLKAIADADRKYKRHFLDLDGLGIRELCLEGSGSLLILAGSTMDLDGSHSLFRLNEPFTLLDNSLSSLKNGQLTYLGEVSGGYRCDRAEGLSLYDGGRSILVVYDSPGRERLIKDEGGSPIGVYADILALN